MSKRISSRDDLFLSAVDLYTLLSFMFIGVAVMANYGMAQPLANLGLPTITSEVTLATTSDDDIPIVRWAEGAPPSNSEGTCSFKVERAGRLRGLLEEGTYEIACQPSAFAGIPSSVPWLRDIAEIWRAENNEGAKIGIICDQGLEPCARLQWIVAENGFVPFAKVRLAIKAGKQ